MNVISLFNGMGCGWLALDKAGIPVGKRYSSEIDKYAIKVNDSNYPDTIQLGDITKWIEWDIDWITIDLVLAGSPCQGFSFAGKGLNFEDERSKLFFVFVEILNHIKQFNPKILFLLENVQMKYEHELVISRYVGCNPILINSALLSAQNRVRNYWTNINSKPVGLFEDMEADIPQPKDKGIKLKDVLETEIDEKYYCSKNMIDYIYSKNRLNKGRISIDTEKSLPILVGCGNNSGTFIKRGFDYNFGDIDGKTNTLMSRYYKDGKECLIKTDINGIPKSNQNKASCLSGGAHSGGNHSDMDLIIEDDKIRRLTPIECERLQTVPDNYTIHVSNTQRYKMLGNGWTVDVIAYIFGFIKAEIYNVQPRNDMQCGVGKK